MLSQLSYTPTGVSIVKQEEGEGQGAGKEVQKEERGKRKEERLNTEGAENRRGHGEWGERRKTKNGSGSERTKQLKSCNVKE